MTFTADGWDPDEIKAELLRRGINVSVATPLSARLDMERRGLDSLVRASVHYFNTDDEVARLIGAVADLPRRVEGTGSKRRRGSDVSVDRRRV